MGQLPVFKEHTVDVRLKQFRRVDGEVIEFIPFDSAEGERLLNAYIKSLRKNSQEFREVLQVF